MKRYVIMLLSLIFSFCARAETKNITLTFDESDFIFENSEKGASITSVIHPIYISNDTCLPALPMIPISIQVESAQKFESFSFSYQDTLIRKPIEIKPNQPPITTNNDTLFYTTKSNYTNDIFPKNIVKYTGSSIIDGYKIISFLISPFSYNVSKKELFLINNLSIEITLNNSRSSINEESNITGKRMSGIIRNFVENKQDINIIPTPVEQYDYLIITNNLLKDSFQKLAKWKSIKGVRTKVLTVEEIDSLYIAGSIQDKIKKAIKNYYNGDYIGLKYLLLGGDESIVPDHKTYIRDLSATTTLSVNEEEIDTCSTDIFYGCLDNLEWNNTTNVGYEAVNDNIDIVADIIVSRLCVNSKYSANTQIDRIINYESKPDTTEWENKVLMTGFIPEIDTYLLGQTTYNCYIRPYWLCSQTQFYDNYTDFNGCENYDIISQNLSDELGKGYTFVNMDFHGDTTLLKLEVDEFSYLDARNIKNKKNSIILTSACNTNDFSIVPFCLSEEFMRNRDGGILAYLGSSAKGFVGASFFFNQQFYKYLLTSNNHQIGEAFYYVKTLFSQMWDKNINENNTYRYLYYSINFLGDPEMSVYLSKPQTFNNIKISYDSGSLSVETGVDDCKICVSSMEDGVFYNIKENTDNIQLSNLYNLYYICVTKQGFIPYVAIIGNDVYIQNEIFNDNQDIYSSRTFIGSDVTNTQNSGEVIIKKGKTTITHTNGVHITKGFTVKEGAEFRVTNN
ncbi:MAG: hypothetical protein J6L03_03225 [Bacteroidaceae bacterium]|nr:hypothetical protein [Bacteroidaceae bacterium]